MSLWARTGNLYHHMAYSTQCNEVDSYSERTISRKKNCRVFLSIILAIAIIVVIIIALAVPLGVINEKYRSSSAGSAATTTLCLTPECVKLAASVLAAIDQTVDPCTDFYKFSCGNWIRNTIIPTGEFRRVSYSTHMSTYMVI